MRRPGPHLTAEETAALDALLASGMTAKAAAAASGCSPRTAERRARRLRGHEPPGRRKPAAEPREVFALREEVKRLRAALAAERRGALDDDAIRILLGRIAAPPAEPPAWLGSAGREPGKRTPEVPVAIWSDWHLGETVSPDETNGINLFDLATAERRVDRLVTSTIRLARDHGPGLYPGIVINLLGDFVSGGLHPELAKTDAEESIPAALRARDLLVAGLDRMIEHFGRVYCPCASGNHGRATLKPEHKRYVYKNFDWLIYQLLARHYADEPRIVFDVPAANEVHYRVFGRRFLAMHGDMLGVKGGDGIIGAIGPIARGEVKVGKQSAAIGRDYDVLLMGHWHQMLWLPRVIVANSLKGFDEYAKNALRAPPSEPSQPLFFVHPVRGITSRWEVMVEEPAAPPAAEWVSWKGSAAA